MPALETMEVRRRLNDLPRWFDRKDAIQRKFTFRTFTQAIAFVNRVAEEAERTAHHPDMCINYNTVGVVLTTHSDGGITEKDIYLARMIDDIARAID